MRIACLQFAPQIGDVNNNLNRADAVLNKANPENLDLLVLPELAFTGYNFKSLNEISPFLEPTGAGITSLWARTTALKYNCVVAAGYPEKVDVASRWPTSPEYYNSLILVNEDGETIANYRKSHLYYTDETWALEGSGFESGHIGGLGRVTLGICMDLNPYKFEAPWSNFEFAFHALDAGSNVVVLSMAWLTREDGRHFSRMPKEPDMETMTYWVKRLEPLIRADNNEEIIVIFANRIGIEDDAVYAGTSAVIGIKHGEVSVYGLLGRGEKNLLVVDTSLPPYAKLLYRPEPIPNLAVHAPEDELSENPPESSALGGANTKLLAARPEPLTLNGQTLQNSGAKQNAVENTSVEHAYRILGGHVFITQDAPTPMSATSPLTPFLDDTSPISPRYFSVPSESTRTPEFEVSQSPTSSTRSNHSSSPDVRKGNLLNRQAKDDRSSAFRDANTETPEEFDELIKVLRNTSSNRTDDSPRRPFSAMSRNASRTGRGERSDSVLSRRPPSVFGNHSQCTIIESDGEVFRPESPTSRNASRNQSRTRVLEPPAGISDRHFVSASRSLNRSETYLDEGASRNRRRPSVNESAIDDSDLPRHLSASPDLEKIGADLLVFEEGARRPRRDSLECHADEDDFIVFHASQRQPNYSKPNQAERPASRRAGSSRGLKSPSLSTLKSPRGGRSSSKPQVSPDLPVDSRAVSRGRKRSTDWSPRKSSPMGRGERQASSSQPKLSKHVKSPAPMKESSRGPEEHLLSGRVDSPKVPASMGRATLSPKAPIHHTSRETSLESLYATSIRTTETTSAPTTPEALPPTPKAMVLTPDWDNILPSARVIDPIPLKCLDQGLQRPKSVIW